MASKKESCRISTQFIESLIRGMGHDIGAPARHVVHFSQMLEERDPSLPLEDKHERWLGLIHDSGKLIQEMLASLTKLSHLSSRANETNPIDLREVFYKVLSFHKRCAVDSTQIKTTVKGDWPEVVGSLDHWKTLFSCLLDNSLKFQPKDSKQVIEISARCEYVDSELFFVLDDNGIGITEPQTADITRSFKRFQSTDDYPGLGMGLAYCDLIAELNEATISFDRSPLGGLRVTYRQHISQSHAPIVTQIQKG